MRPPADAFDLDWPAGYTRASLDPYYDLAAHMLDIGPIEPDPATGALPAKTTLMEDAVRRAGRSAQTFRPNIAVRFDGAGKPAVRNRFGALQTGCTFCGECDIGCNVAAKNTLDLNYLTVAESLGARVGTECEATRITPVETGFAVSYRDLAEGRDRTVTAQQVFLCLGAVNSTELLLRCRDEYGSLPRLSPRLGTGFSANGDLLALGLGVSPPFGAMHRPTITTACIFDRRDGDRRTWFVVEDGGYTTYVAHLLPPSRPRGLPASWAASSGIRASTCSTARSSRPLSERTLRTRSPPWRSGASRARSDGCPAGSGGAPLRRPTPCGSSRPKTQWSFPRLGPLCLSPRAAACAGAR
jgi:cholesterol oxidase